MQPRVIVLWALLLNSLLPAPLWAQDPASWPLFSDDAALAAVLELPMGELRPGRQLEEPLPAKLIYSDGGAEQVLDLEVTTRGHSRLELCDLPPLKLDFQRGQLDGTLFAGQNKLKLVTHCQAKANFYRYLQHEYALYRSYATLTDAAFRVRMLELTYRDSDGRRREKTRAAFLIESDREVAARLGYEEVEVPVVRNSELDPLGITVFGLFQFLAGNTDWSLRKGRGGEGCCHNGLLLRKPAGRYVIVPYDFDQAGLVNADYALPARGLGISSVRQRLFRGLCTGEEYFSEALELMNERRPVIESGFPLSGRMKRSNRRALRYIDEFYAIVNDPRERQEWIGESCRGTPEDWVSPAAP